MPKTKEKESLSSYDKFLLKKRNHEIAINLLKEGSKVEFVSRMTSLTIAEVEELKKNLK